MQAVIEHCRRVARLVDQIWPMLGSPSTFDHSIAVGAARLHDAGKCAWPAELLQQTGTLSADGWRIVQRHPVVSAQLLRDTGARSELTAIVLTHHERWDGRGYPLGLRGDAVPFAARLIAILDAFDAMTHDRPYRTALPIDAALAELEAGAGTQFDPALIGEVVPWLADQAAACRPAHPLPGAAQT